jgi:hypothetical protein
MNDGQPVLLDRHRSGDVMPSMRLSSSIALDSPVR